MAKSNGKTKETVILIRIPDAEARRGEASLTIQRGELGHLHQFTYTGLTLRGNITEAVQTALIALAKLEVAPPPKFDTTNTQAQTEITVTTAPLTDENDSDVDEAGDTDDEEGVEDSEANADDDDTPIVVHQIVVPAPTSESAERTTRNPQPLEDAVPVNTAQMSLF